MSNYIKKSGEELAPLCEPYSSMPSSEPINVDITLKQIERLRNDHYALWQWANYWKKMYESLEQKTL